MLRFASHAGVVALIVAVSLALAWWTSPWPRVWLIRYFFDRGGVATARALAPHVPAGTTEVANLAYRPGAAQARLDVFFPQSITNTDARLPTVVWVHGGGWVAGHRGDVANYARILAAHGFTTVAIDYGLPPDAVYPTQVEEVNAALAYLAAHAAALHVDPRRFVLAGDSAGAQIAAQVANVIVNPGYARALGVAPSIAPAQLRAVVLACGAYDFERMQGHGGLYAKFFEAAFWAYTGKRDFKRDPRVRLMSVARALTPAFPPSFITAGNGDPLVAQSRELAARLIALDVPVDALLYPPDHVPRLPHEYQFNLDRPDGRAALERIVAFLRNHTAEHAAATPQASAR